MPANILAFANCFWFLFLSFSSAIFGDREKKKRKKKGDRLK